ncbi:hypothetical protein [Shewanella surugensis]|uniref:Uncharacterized protein n=1 Tax=Shewanella surugensis TaxID=212020 RepID=A0ABT0LGB2_9GAMM|nr:hypothetical protein [Shewanella surugensis]MCL1126718.1 hypothetical protein [Shewanella surugensis]
MSLLIDIVGLIGLSLLSYGSWLAWPPAGFIVCGMLLVLYAIKANAQPKNKR